MKPSHSFISSNRNSLEAFISKQLSLLFVCGQGPKNTKQRLITLLPQASTSICDGSTLKTSHQLIYYLQQQLRIPPPKTTLKLTQHLDYIYTTSIREKKHVFLLIHNSHLIPLPVLAAIAHFTLLQEDNPTLSTVILTNERTIQQTAQLGLKRFPLIALDDLEKILIFKDSSLKKLKLKKPKNHWIFKPQTIAATLTTCFVSISLISKYEKHHIQKNVTKLPNPIFIRAHQAPLVINSIKVKQQAKLSHIKYPTKNSSLNPLKYTHH